MTQRDQTITDNPEVGFEASDLSAHVVGKIALGLVVFLAVAPSLLSIIYARARQDADRRLTIHPPQPTLQLNPANDFEKYRAAEEKRLTTYGWIDRNKGIIHIPIDQAMAAVARNGIPDFPKARP